MRFVIGADDEHPMVDEVERVLRAGGHDLDRLDVSSWPDVGLAVGQAVAESRADRGVVMCWTGTGVSIAANKVDGVRAALCHDAYTADGARRWNDANVLALSMRSTSIPMVAEIVDAFVDGEPDADERDNIDRLR